MRIFVSIELPFIVRQEIIRIQDIFKKQIFSLKYIPEEQLHITLAFNGSIAEEDLESAKDKLQSINSPPFIIQLDAIAQKPYVLWVAVHGSELAALAKQTQEALNVKENRPFLAHITFARTKNNISAIAYPTIERLSWQPTTLSLQQSKTGPHGPEYTVLETFPLTPQQRQKKTTIF